MSRSTVPVVRCIIANGIFYFYVVFSVVLVNAATVDHCSQVAALLIKLFIATSQLPCSGPTSPARAQSQRRRDGPASGPSGLVSKSPSIVASSTKPCFAGLKRSKYAQVDLVHRASTTIATVFLASTNVLEGVSSELTKLTSRAAFVYDLESQQVLLRMGEHEKREIASLTKIMTCWVVLQHIRSREIIPEDNYLTVSRNAAAMAGTRADLEEGDVLTIWDLLYGLMLPSGNDAAVCLAENIGQYFPQHGKKTALENFVEEMNCWARKLDLKNTVYINPHGMSLNKVNISTVSDQAKLIQYALQDTVFTRLVDKRMYPCSIQDRQGWTRQLFWENTNRLLFRGYSGIKTGSTNGAGFCLASWFRKSGCNLLVIVLGASTAEHRFQETLQLTRMIVSERVKTNRELLQDRDITNLLQQ